MQFTTFITPTITGEIKNYFRDKSRMIKLPRRLNEISGVVKKYSAEYEAEYGVKPNVKTIADELKISEEDVVHALEVGGTVSLDSMASNEEGESSSLYSLISDDENSYEEFETKETLRAVMRDFSDTEKALVKYRYVDELSQSDTAEKLGVSQMFVSRMERKLLAKLKEKLKESI
jgi:RNA polymerase sigma-B factor